MDKEKKKSIKQRIEHFLKDILKECKDKKTLAVFFIVVVVIYSPVWLCGLLYFIFKYKTFLVVATACFAFWAGPGTPFFPLCVAITLAIRKLMERKEHEQQITVLDIQEEQQDNAPAEEGECNTDDGTYN